MTAPQRAQFSNNPNVVAEIFTEDKIESLNAKLMERGISADQVEGAIERVVTVPRLAAILHVYRMHVKTEFLISPAASDAEVRRAGRARAAASTGIEAGAACRSSSKGDADEIIKDRRSLGVAFSLPRFLIPTTRSIAP